MHSTSALNLVGENAAHYTRLLSSTTARYFYWIDDASPMCRCPACRGFSDSDQALLLENHLLRAIRQVDSRANRLMIMLEVDHHRAIRHRGHPAALPRVHGSPVFVALTAQILSKPPRFRDKSIILLAVGTIPASSVAELTMKLSQAPAVCPRVACTALLCLLAGDPAPWSVRVVFRLATLRTATSRLGMLALLGSETGLSQKALLPMLEP